jgi:nucleoside-diphosphate-sugar epimerase
MKVLVTGARGYIGIPLCSFLLDRGHEVVGLDAQFYAERHLDTGVLRYPHCITKDTRTVTTEDLHGFDAVVHLAELSNDPLGQLRPNITYEINHAGSVRLASSCKQAGVTRFVYSSSCSVYGAGGDAYRTEESETEPQTAYARCKLLVERDVGLMADDDFSPTFLRNATVYGPAPSMRFDLVLNNLAGLAWTTGQIRMTSDGSPLRPLVHVRDVCLAMACTLEAPREVVHRQTFNVGDTRENYRVRDIAEAVSEAFPGCQVSFGASNGDARSYRVSFEKIHERLPGFQRTRTAANGAAELREFFETIQLSRDTFEFRTFTRVEQLKHLLNTERLDRHFFWTRTR